MRTSYTSIMRSTVLLTTLLSACALAQAGPFKSETVVPTPGWAASGPRWELYTGEGDLPKCALVGGYQIHLDHPDGSQASPHYVGRAFHDGAVTPITVTNYGRWLGYGAWNDGFGSATDIRQFEVACADEEKVRWVPAQNGHVPDGAVVAGIEDGQDVFVCRVFDTSAVNTHLMMMTPGVLRPATGVCSLHFYGVKSFPVYEVLVAANDFSVTKST